MADIDDASEPRDPDSESAETSTATGAGLGSGNGDVQGTLSYAAPELLLGVRPTTAIDMWATGCLLSEMLTGRVLFPASTIVQQVCHNAWHEKDF